LPVIAGNPPADAAQPFGINGIIVRVIMNERHEPIAPRIPNLLYQNSKNKSAPNNHSDTPKNQLAPRMPKTGYNQEIRGPLLIKGDQCLRLIVKPFLIPKEEEDNHHRCANQVVIKIVFENAGFSQELYEKVHNSLLC
jgi:hypothetical protein